MEQFIWESARSTSAAPSYFHPYNQFLDGGLMSNNPTLDILTEIHEFKKEQTVTISDGQPTDRASAWCEMMNVPFFRLSPLLTEEVPLDCVDKQKLEQMIQETKSYIGEQMDSITKIAQYLKRA
ncbi:85/88 kDa calcium-independent phospholipase A2-like [Dreissena polymorpha]|nr:85/88 kDa calcium-independent phospholipase A2-like [Dreissena polymorpha]